MTILSLGEILWDVFPDREELGGAPFNLAFHASRLGHEPVFISAVGDDARGHRALQAATKLGIDTSFIQTNPELGTGVVTVSLDLARQPSFMLARPAAYDRVTLTDRQIEKIAAAGPEWICFGTLFFCPPSNVATLRRLLEACPRARRFYDVNLRPGNWTEALVRELLPLADVVKVNEAEMETLEPLASAARGLVCVTRAERGCTIDGTEVPGYRVKVADAVGAGDAFSAGLLHGLSEGWPAVRAADFANRVGAIVASRPGANHFWTVGELDALTR
jgi:fructokinase